MYSENIFMVLITAIRIAYWITVTMKLNVELIGACGFNIPILNREIPMEFSISRYYALFWRCDGLGTVLSSFAESCVLILVKRHTDIKTAPGFYMNGISNELKLIEAKIAWFHKTKVAQSCHIFQRLITPACVFRSTV